MGSSCVPCANGFRGKLIAAGSTSKRDISEILSLPNKCLLCFSRFLPPSWLLIYSLSLELTLNGGAWAAQYRYARGDRDALISGIHK
jgi:hypothetical protein